METVKLNDDQMKEIKDEIKANPGRFLKLLRERGTGFPGKPMTPAEIEANEQKILDDLAAKRKAIQDQEKKTLDDAILKLGGFHCKYEKVDRIVVENCKSQLGRSCWGLIKFCHSELSALELVAYDPSEDCPFFGGKDPGENQGG